MIRVTRIVIDDEILFAIREGRHRVFVPDGGVTFAPLAFRRKGDAKRWRDKVNADTARFWRECEETGDYVRA